MEYMDIMDEEQLKELDELMDEPADKDTISVEEFMKLFARFNPAAAV